MYSFDIDQPRTFLRIEKHEVSLEAGVTTEFEVRNGVPRLLSLKTEVDCRPDFSRLKKMPSLKYVKHVKCEVNDVPREIDYFRNMVSSLVFNIQRSADERPIFQMLKDARSCYDYYEVNLLVKSTEPGGKSVVPVFFDVLTGLMFWFGLSFITVVKSALQYIKSIKSI